MAEAYCKTCDKIIETKKDYNTAVLLLAIFFCWPAAIIYYLSSDEVCPVCGGRPFGELSEAKGKNKISRRESRKTGKGERDKKASDQTKDKVYDYIVENEGMIRLSECASDLNFSEEEIEKAIKKLESEGKLERFSE